MQKCLNISEELSEELYKLQIKGELDLNNKVLQKEDGAHGRASDDSIALTPSTSDELITLTPASSEHAITITPATSDDTITLTPATLVFDREGTAFRPSLPNNQPSQQHEMEGSIAQSIAHSMEMQGLKKSGDWEYSLFPESMSKTKKLSDGDRYNEGDRCKFSESNSRRRPAMNRTSEANSSKDCKTKANGKDFSMFFANGYGNKGANRNFGHSSKHTKQKYKDNVDYFFDLLEGQSRMASRANTLAQVKSMIIDPFGHYMCLQHLDVIDFRGRQLMFEAIGSDVVDISCHFHGTRVVQKLLEKIKDPFEIAIATVLFREHVVVLSKDLYGMHVIRKYMYHADLTFVDTIARNIVKLSSHKYGCCVVQWCLDHVYSEKREHLMDFLSGDRRRMLLKFEMQRLLISSISDNALQLMNDSHGNYIVQKLFDISKHSTRYSSIVRDVMVTLLRNIDQLAVQKFSSIVVEKCFIMADDDIRDLMVRELILKHPRRLQKLLPDPFANYIIQKMMLLTKGETFRCLVYHIRQHFAALEISQLGKKIEFQMLLKFPILKPGANNYHMNLNDFNGMPKDFRKPSPVQGHTRNKLSRKKRDNSKKNRHNDDRIWFPKNICNWNSLSHFRDMQANPLFNGML